MVAPAPRSDDDPIGASGGSGVPWWAWAILIAGAVALAIAFALPSDESAPSKRGHRGSRGEAKATPVSVAVVERRAFRARTTYPGELDADQADVGANVSGRLVAVDVRLGDAVAKGDRLAAIDDAGLKAERGAASAAVRAASAARQRAVVELDTARLELSRVKALAERGVASRRDLEVAQAGVDALEAARGEAAGQLASARARLDVIAHGLSEATVKAPFTGVVTRRMRDPGSYVQRGDPIVRLVARAPLRVRFEVPEQHAAELRDDASVEVRTMATGQQRAVAEVAGIAREVDRDRRVVFVEAIVADPPESWYPGMYADVIAVRLEVAQALVVPESAVLTRLVPGGSVEAGIFVAREDQARWVPVVVMGRDAGDAAVKGAVKPGERVLIGGHADLTDEAPIQVAAPAP